MPQPGHSSRMTCDRSLKFYADIADKEPVLLRFIEERVVACRYEEIDAPKLMRISLSNRRLDLARHKLRLYHSDWEFKERAIPIKDLY